MSAAPTATCRLVEVAGTFTPSAEVSALRPWPLDALPLDLPAGQRWALMLAIEA
jgi:hypothetical protein